MKDGTVIRTVALNLKDTLILDVFKNRDGIRVLTANSNNGKEYKFINNRLKYERVVPIRANNHAKYLPESTNPVAVCNDYRVALYSFRGIKRGSITIPLKKVKEIALTNKLVVVETIEDNLTTISVYSRTELLFKRDKTIPLYTIKKEKVSSMATMDNKVLTIDDVVKYSIVVMEENRYYTVNSFKHNLNKVMLLRPVDIFKLEDTIFIEFRDDMLFSKPRRIFAKVTKVNYNSIEVKILFSVHEMVLGRLLDYTEDKAIFISNINISFLSLNKI